MRDGFGVAVLLGVLLTPAQGLAHALNVECKALGSTIEAEVYYSDDIPADDATVTVIDEQGRVVAQGRTDEHGVWSFARPAPGQYRIEARSPGHRAVTTLTIVAETLPPLTEGPTREDFTRTRWKELGLGLLVIASLTGVAWMTRKRSSSDR